MFQQGLSKHRINFAAASSQTGTGPSDPLHRTHPWTRGDYTGEPEIQDGTGDIQGDEQPVEGDAEQPETDEAVMGQPDVSTGQNTSRDDDPSHRSSGEDAVEQIDGHQSAGQSAESNNQPSSEKQ